MTSRLLQKFSMLLLLFAGILSLSSKAQSVIIGSQSGSTSYFYGPYYRSSSASSFNYSRYAYLYNNTELGIPAGSIITQIEWYKASGTITGNNTFNVWLDNSSSTSLASGTSWNTLTATATQVYSSTTQSFTAAANSWESFTLSTPYTYNGGNLVILTDHVKSGTASAANNYYYNSASGMAIGYASSAAPSGTTTLSTSSYGNNRPTIRITYMPGTPCSGTVTAGTITAPTAICPNTTFAVSLSGYTAGTGMSYEWDSSPAGMNTWTTITGATAPSYNVSGGITAATDYRAIVTCSNGGSADTVSAAVATNPFYNCYCTPVSTCVNEGIDSVSFDVLNNSSSFCVGSGYSDYASLGASATVSQAQAALITVRAHINSNPASVGLWIDYDHSGTFDAAEYTSLGSTTGISPLPSEQFFSGNIVVPITAQTGVTRMRIRSANQGGITNTSACNTGTVYGEYEDYLVTINPGISCTGTPVGGTVYGADSVCPNIAFTLVDTGMTSAVGITYQWETSPAGAGMWTPITGATNLSYTQIAGITAATDFHLLVTCTNGGGTDVSNAYTVNMKSFVACYCTPGTTTSTSSDNILNVTFAGINNTTTTGGVNGYVDYTGTVAPAQVLAGLSYPYSMTINNGGTEYGGVWFDWDHSGTFDTSEFTYVGTGSLTPLNATISVPLTALSGTTRMRVRSKYNTLIVNTDPCTGYSYGETEDYLVNVTIPAACSGTPVAGTAYGPDSICASTAFNLADTAFTAATGIAYQWEESPAGAGIWTPISGATNPYFTISAGITSATDYHMIITCTNGGGTDISNTTTVNMSDFYRCYCSPLTGTTLHTYGYNYLTNVSITGTTLSNPSTTVGAGGYTQYYPTTTSTTANLVQGIQYTLNATAQYTGYPISGWVDMDGSGTFDTSEYVQMTPDASGYNYSGSFIVPYSGVSGNTGIRLRIGYNPGFNSSQACYNYGSGYETEDYVVNVIAPAACSGSPTAGTAFASDSVCASTSFILSDTAYSIGSGITYQWEESPAGAGIWTAISGATNPTYTVAAGITSATDYHLIITCTNGGATDVSNTVTVDLNQFYKCYCASNALYTSDEDVFNLTIGGLNNSSTCSTTGTGVGSVQNMYSNYTDVPAASGMQGATMPFSIQIGTCGSFNYNNWTKLYIDYNQDGDYNDAGEEVYSSSNYTSGAHTESGVLTIPVTATAGVTGMRVVNVETTAASSVNPCGTYGYGETEDYLINITAAVGCTGTPSAGDAYAPDSICSGIAFTLSDTASTVASGISYQWEESPSGAGTWTAISGATNANYNVAAGITAATDYRLVVTCTNTSTTAISDTLSIGINPPNQCYCTPTVTNQDELIGNVSVSTLNNSSSGFGVQGYQDFTNLPATPLSVSVPYTLSATISPFYSTDQIAVWIDMNQDGTFDNLTERLINVAPSSGSMTGTITVPATASLGITRMRVRLAYSNANPSPCGNESYGNIEDYMVNITTPPTCALPSGLSATNTTSISTDLSWTENGTATQWSIEYGLTGFTQGTGTYVSVTTNPYTLTGLSAGSAYDIYVKSICSTTDSSSNSAGVTVNTDQIPVNSYPYAVNWDNGNGGWTYANGNQANKWFVGAPGDNPAAAFGASPAGLYVSNDGGVTNGYDNTSSTYVHAYRDLDLTSFSTTVPLTFNSYVVGETPNWDYLSVWIVPITYDPIPGSAVSGGTQIGTNINGETGWTQHLLNIPASYAGTMARLVLQWRNDGGSGSAPVKVDNLTIGGFPLVIKLKDINATNLGAKNRVDWSTESELKSDKFELERSADGRNFTYLATIKAKGEASNYSYVDISPVTGVNYYRLKMIDAAGAVATSKVVTATVKQGAFTVEAYPNPVSEKLTVQVYGGSDQNATVSITDVTGKVMKVISVVNGKAEVNMNGLASGVYLVKYTDNNHSQTIKVNKQ